MGFVSAAVFQGTSGLLLDGKGRISVPVLHRDKLMQACEGRLTLTRHPDGYLLLFPRPVFDSFRDRLLAMTLDTAGWRRMFLGSAVELELDNAARVLVPPELRAAAGLDKELLMVGNGHLLELWDKQRFVDQEAGVIAGGMPAEIKSFVL